MKKLLPIILALMVLLTACGTPAPAASESPSPSPTVEPSITPSASTSTVKTLDFTKEKYFEVVDKFSADEGYKTIASITPTEMASDSSKTTLAYELCPGFTLFLDEDPSTKELLSIWMMIEKDIISIDDLKYFGFVNMTTIYQMEGDGAEDIINTLNIAEISEDKIKSANSEYRSYSYIIDGDSIMFMVSPN